MSSTIIALSGPICSGKTTLAKLLEQEAGGTVIKTREMILSERPKTKQARRSLQLAGESLDRDTNGQWVARQVGRKLQGMPTSPTYIVIDSVRIEAQLVALRRAFGNKVIHIHLDAGDDSLSVRYSARSEGSSTSELKNLAEAQKNKTEKNVRALARIADIVIETDRCTAQDVWTRVSARIGFRLPNATRLVDVLIGGQYGSEGKGNIVHHLAPEYDILVRVGGPNAGHKVFIPDEKPFTFHQLPSGALANSSAHLILGAGAVISLERLLSEIASLSVPYDRLSIDPQAMIIEKADIQYEQGNLRDEIASTAQGVGSATARKILNRKVETDVRLARDIPELKHYIRDTIHELSKAICAGKRILLEGTQGTSLSLHHGHYPHVTSRVTTAVGCLAEAGISAQHLRRVVLVCRSYPIRVGNTDSNKTSGHMEQEIDLEMIAKRSGLDIEELKKTERTSTTNRARRIAEFDWAQMKRSVFLNGPTDIALTFADYINSENRNAYRFDQLSPETVLFIEELEKVFGVPVSLISTQFALRNIIDRRSW